MSNLDALHARAKALKLHGLLAHWTELADVQRQSGYVIHHHMSRKIALPDTGFAGRSQNRVNLVDRKGLRYHSKTDEIGDPPPRRECRNGTCHLARPLIRKIDSGGTAHG